VKLAVISNLSGCTWAGSEALWHLAALRALKEGHEVTAFLHADVVKSKQVAEFVSQGGLLRVWKALSIARFQRLKELLHPTFPKNLLHRFDRILVSLGSLPSLTYVPGLVEGLLGGGIPTVLLCQFNAGHLYISTRERELVRRAMERSAACVFLSQRNLDEARRQFAIEPPGSEVLRNPIRTVLQQPLAWPELGRTVRFASVARFETAWKGQDILLEILRQPQWLSREWHLTFYGNGPDETHLRHLVNFFHLENRVIFAGFVSDLHEIWAKNHLLVMPSHGEGLPLAALEAMMFGRPAVLSDVGGNAELIKEGRTGFLADASTVKFFGNALERAWESQKYWPDMGRSAHETAKKIAASDATGQLLGIWAHR
jgi:glycosyltransferase involved in cell wall biosynthesis